MNIKNKLMISHVILIIIMTLCWISYSFIDYNEFQEKTKSLADNALSEFSIELGSLTKTYIEPFSQHYVELKTKVLSDTISEMLSKTGNKESEITSNKNIRKIFNEFLTVKNGVIVGYSYLINSKNQIILSPNENSTAITKGDWKDKFPQLFELIESAKLTGVAKGYYNFYDVNNTGIVTKVGKKYGVIMRVPNTDYYVGTTIFLENYKSLTQKQLKGFEKEVIYKIDRKFEKHSKTLLTGILLKTISTVIIIAAIFILIGYLIAKNISDPILKLAKKVRGISTGNFNFSLSRDSYKTPEVKELSDAFKFLGEELEEYMDNLKHEMSERQLIDRDLDVAREIQDHALPVVTPDFCKSEFDISGFLKPAKKVAGDFYDFYYLSDNKLAVVIGDVSGKGISAAYFMAKIKTLLQSFCMDEKKDPAIVLNKLNKVISKDNKSFMFATLFLGYYDFSTGTLTYSNAGHHPAIRIHQDKTITEFGEQENPILGFFSDSLYTSQSEVFKQDEFLVLYTDGICEATNSDNEMFGKVRFLQSCLKHQNMNINTMLKGIVEDTAEFEGDTSQTDDITVVGLIRK